MIIHFHIHPAEQYTRDMFSHFRGDFDAVVILEFHAKTSKVVHNSWGNVIDQRKEETCSCTKGDLDNKRHPSREAPIIVFVSPC
jgi:hypothetical protein